MDNHLPLIRSKLNRQVRRNSIRGSLGYAIMNLVEDGVMQKLGNGYYRAIGPMWLKVDGECVSVGSQSVHCLGKSCPTAL